MLTTLALFLPLRSRFFFFVLGPQNRNGVEMDDWLAYIHTHLPRASEHYEEV